MTTIEQLSPVTIRVAGPDDAGTLARLAALDSRPPLAGPVLLAEVGSVPVAALALDDGRAVADPFRPTADVVALLAAQRARLLAARGRGRRGRLVARLAPARLRPV